VRQRIPRLDRGRVGDRLEGGSRLAQCLGGAVELAVAEIATSETTIDAPLDQTFRFFSDARNLGLLTPPAMGLRIDGTPPAMAEGACIDYRIRVGPVPSLAWRTRIVKWEPGRCFVDVQERGPYASWWHEHAFEADGARTRVRDRVCYAPPLPSLLGALVNRVVVAPMLRRIFGYRGEVIRLRFARRS
jgi:ligand-binding SRPBCC domain-containing protein